MAYALQSLPQASTAEDQMKALQDTIQQLIAEGLSPDEAQQQALALLQQNTPATRGFASKTSNYMIRPEPFARGGSGMTPSGPSQGFNNVLNPRLNNFNPITGPGGYTNK